MSVVVKHSVREGTHLPPRSWENVFIPLVPTSLDNLAGVRLILLNRGVGQQSNIVVDVKVEQGPRLAPCLVD